MFMLIFGLVKGLINEAKLEASLEILIFLPMQPGSTSIQLLEREVEVLQRVNHPSIIQVHAVYETGKVSCIIRCYCRTECG